MKTFETYKYVYMYVFFIVDDRHTDQVNYTLGAHLYCESKQKVFAVYHKLQLRNSCYPIPFLTDEQLELKRIKLFF